MRICGALPLVAVVLAWACTARTPTPPPATEGRPPRSAPYLDPAQPLEVRVADLLGRMTLEEKVSQTRYDAPAIPRLGIPAYNWWSEALHGVARAGLATVFPQVIGLAATWDEPLLGEIGDVISTEARAKHAAFVARGHRDIYQGLTFFTPNINIFRDPRWGRGQETFGEDPQLTSRLAVAFVEGLQGNDPRYLKVLATSKHYAVHSGPEPLRHGFDARPTEQDLWDTYLPAFQATVQEGRVGSVMCAYSALRGDPACASSLLLQEILRQRWGFQGYVVSDCWALTDFYQFHHVVSNQVEAAALAARRGTDLNCGVSFQRLDSAVTQGLMGEAVLDTAGARLLRARFRLGMFDPPELVPWSRIPYSEVASPAHHALALRAARESMVLLKNDGLLPLRKDLQTIAVIGPDARNYETLVGNYHGTPATVSYPLDAIRAHVPGARVLYAEGAELVDGLPVLEAVPSTVLHSASGQPGLDASYWGNAVWRGTPSFQRVDTTVDFIWKDDTPITGELADSFSVRWSGTLVAPATGTYRIGVRGMNHARFYIADSLRTESDDRHVPLTRTVDLDLQAGQRLPIRIEVANYGPDPVAQLLWSPPEPDRLDRAVTAARQADAVVLVLGLSPDLEGEEGAIHLEGFDGGDRTVLDLPPAQQQLMRAVVAVGKPTVLVLLSGSAVAVPWAADQIPAILQAWYPGEAGGEAIADVLFGDYSPAGRLPVTVYRSVTDLPPFQDYDMAGRTYRYFPGTPLFPFGHGLSYTTFAYGRLRLPDTASAATGLSVSVDVTNTGDRAGDEVVQLYLSHPAAGFRTPLRALRAFRRIHLAPGETRTVHFSLGVDDLSVVDPAGRRVAPPGPMEIAVGGKQPGFTGTADAATTGVLTGRVVLTR